MNQTICIETIREMTGNERKFLWIPAANVTLAARVSGRIDERAFRNAAAKLSLRHPLIRSRVRREGDRAWFVSSGVPEIPVRFVPRDSDSQWLDEVMTEYKTPFSPETGPLIRFTVVHSDTVSDVIVYCQHSICDGTALVYVLRDLLSLAAEPGLTLGLSSAAPGAVSGHPARGLGHIGPSRPDARRRHR